MNLTDPSIMHRKEQANAVLDQTKEREETQQQALEITVLKTHKNPRFRNKT